MKITSSTFEHEGLIPAKHTCSAEGISPPLAISDVPSEAKSLALIMDDTDVPTFFRADGMWVHWVVFNIPPTISEINEGQEPEGIHGAGTGENLNYYGPCPPDKEHRYYFKLYALDAMLDLQEKATKEQVEAAMEGHILAKAELMGRYSMV